MCVRDCRGFIRAARRRTNEAARRNPEKPDRQFWKRSGQNWVRSRKRPSGTPTSSRNCAEDDARNYHDGAEESVGGVFFLKEEPAPDYRDYAAALL